MKPKTVSVPLAFLLITTSKLKVSGALGKQSIFVSIYAVSAKGPCPSPLAAAASAPAASRYR